MTTNSKPNGCLIVIIAFLAICAVMVIIPSGSNKTPEELHRDSVQIQFSPWDGSHMELERFVKKNIRDPESFQHSNTTYFDRHDGTIVVEMTYRARNGFGGMNSCRIVAKVDMQGNILEVLESES